MALASTEAQLFAKDRVKIATATFSGFLSPITKAFFMMMGQFKNQTQLITEVLADETVDRVVADVPCKLYAIWAKKQATATAAFFKVFDDAANDATATDARVCLPLVTTSEEQFWLNPKGFDLAAGLVVGSYTAYTGSNGTTPTTTGDGPNGVLLYGKP